MENDCEHIFKKVAVSGSVTPRADLVEYCTRCNVARAVIKGDDLEYLQSLRVYELRARVEAIVEEIKSLVVVAMDIQEELEAIECEINP